MIKKWHKNSDKITMLTCYDAMMAEIIDKTNLDTILIGDSLGNVFQGADRTTVVSVDDICYHTKAVRSKTNHAFIFSDMPFNSYTTPQVALENAKKMIAAGADGVKLEGNFFDVIKTLTDNGITVCGHIGLLPQTATEFKCQGKDDDDKKKILQDALDIEKAGASLIVIECTSSALATEITKTVTIPTIGIGAGKECDGQVLVINDMLGMNPNKVPKFVKKFANLNEVITNAITQYINEVKDSTFPTESESYK